MISFIRRTIDPGLLIVLALATLASWTLLTRPSLPTMTDAEMHTYRVAEVALSIQRGVLYPRWAPDFYYGFGYPVFNFYAPLAYHLAAYFGLITGWGAVSGAKFVLILSAYLGAIGMYLFGRDRWGAISGVVSSAAFTFSPYIIYIDPHARGDVPQVLALAIAPLVLWSFDRLRRTGSRYYLLLSTLALATLILSHPLMALVVYTFLVAFLAWEILISPLVPQTYLGSEPRRYVPHLVTAVALGLLLSSFYWLPAGAERGAVQLQNVAGPGYFDFHKYFVAPSELFSPSSYFDLGATEPRFNFNLGVPQWILAMAGALTIFSRRLRRLDTLFFTFAAVIFVYLITEASTKVWETIPYMSFFQFPTRFLGPAALAFAALAGNAVRWVERFDGKKLVTATGAVALGAILFAAMPLLYPPQWGEFGAVTPLRMINVELEGRALGTTSADDFLPSTVRFVPKWRDTMMDSYRNGGWIDRADRSSLPEGAEFKHLEQRQYYDRYVVKSSNGFTFKTYLFYFPGWVARVNGREVSVEASDPDGWITFAVPAGENTLEVSFEDTWTRRIGWGLAILALIGLALSFRFANVLPPAQTMTVSMLEWRYAAIFAFVAVLGFGVKIGDERMAWFRFESFGTEVKVAQRSFYVRLERGIQILGYDVHNVTINEGDPLAVTIYWKTESPVPRNYQVYVHLIALDGQLVAQSDKLNPADFPTSRWPTDRYVRDEHNLVFHAPNAPPGQYRLVVGLWDAASGERLKALTAADTSGEGIVLPTLVTIK